MKFKGCEEIEIKEKDERQKRSKKGRKECKENNDRIELWHQYEFLQFP
jgi:hypothetical protein